MPCTRRSPLLAAAFAGTVAAAFVGPVALAPHVAHASTAVALSLEDLVDRSDAVVVGIAKSKASRWEGGRIVTYTTVAIDTAVAGKAKAGEDVVVRTYGGVVDGIGQVTHGEANLPLGKPVVLFLRPLPVAAKAAAGTLSVTGMAQGALAVEIGKDKVARVVSRPTDLVLVPKATKPAPGVAAQPAAVALSGKPLTSAIGEIRTVWTARAKK